MISTPTADDLPDDDPDVVAGMQRLAELRALEQEIPEIG